MITDLIVDGMENQPLVSVGIPTYNRPEGLRRTLECITKQTYANLEIIVSDNCSPGDEVERVVREFQEKDGRILFFKQKENYGPMNNFKFVLEKATGEYFMWAADDDIWKPFFINDLVDVLRKNPQHVAAMMECQYFDDNQLFDFFNEGSTFYSFLSDNSYSRLKFMLKSNYGNLFYSVFRRNALFSGNDSFFIKNSLQSLNEIPLFLFVIEKGNWLVIDKVGMYKKTNIQTYIQARWEIEGGRLPTIPLSQYLFSLNYSSIYHWYTFVDIIKSIRLLPIRLVEKMRLMFLANYLIFRHFYYIISRRR